MSPERLYEIDDQVRELADAIHSASVGSGGSAESCTSCIMMAVRRLGKMNDLETEEYAP